MVRVAPSMMARTGGVVFGGRETVLQGYSPSETRTDDTGVIWVRLANMDDIWGSGEAWTVLNAAPTVVRTETSIESRPRELIRLKPNVDYTCMSFGAWERGGVVIPNYGKASVFGDDCAHFFSVKEGSRACIFCGVLPSPQKDDAKVQVGHAKGVTTYSKPDFAALDANLPPLPEMHTEELLLKAYACGATAMLRQLVMAGVACVSTAPAESDGQLSLLHTAAKDDAKDVVEMVYKYEPEEVRNILLRGQASASTAKSISDTPTYGQAKDVLGTFFDQLIHGVKHRQRRQGPGNTTRVAAPSFSNGLLLTACTAGAEAVTLFLLNVLESDMMPDRKDRHAILNAAVRHSVSNRSWAVLKHLHTMGVAIGEVAESKGQHSPTASLVQDAADDDSVMDFVLDSIDRLVDLGCHIDSCNPAGVTALMLAARRSSPLLMIELMQRGADDTRVSVDGWTAWTYAVKWGNVDALAELYSFKLTRTRESLSGKSINAGLAAELAKHRFGIDHPQGKSTTLDVAIATGSATGDFGVLDFLLDRDCDVMCIGDLKEKVAALIEPRVRSHTVKAAVTIQQWFRRARGRNNRPSMPDNAEGLLLSEGLAAPAPQGQATQPSPPAPPAPPPPPPSMSTTPSTQLRCWRSVTVATRLMRTVAEQANRRIDERFPELKLALSTNAGGDGNAEIRQQLMKEWMATCASLSSVFSTATSFFDEDTDSGKAMRELPSVSMHLEAVHQIASSGAVCRLLWYECHESDVKKTHMATILPWREERCAQKYMAAIQDVKYPTWLLNHLTRHLHANVLRVHAPSILEDILAQAGASSNVDVSKMSDLCSTKKQYMQSGFIPTARTLDTIATLVQRAKGDTDLQERACASAGCIRQNGEDVAVDLIPVLEARLNVEEIAKHQHLRGQHAKRDSACFFIGTCFPDLSRKCGVCLEPISQPTACCSQSGGEHFRKFDCTHEYCKGCVTSWVSSNIEQQLHQIACPHEDCKFIMYPDDVKRILGRENPKVAKYIEYTTASYKERLHDFVIDAGSTWVRQNTRLCPTCYVVIDRSAGCNSMLCTCGARFNWPNGVPVTEKLIEEARAAAEARKSAEAAAAAAPLSESRV
mmetsp:Transcript_25626/g.67206  ORF Transcript_25626/g.67206 Transcript_25626/m.67206 type:complete len:1102 (-) Transcript_25626:118-3423(-)